jgi:hypothetical protein
VSSVAPPRLPKRKKTALTKDGVFSLLKAADYSECKWRARMLVLFLLGELLGLSDPGVSGSGSPAWIATWEVSGLVPSLQEQSIMECQA